jgi:hypothetical protein
MLSRLLAELVLVIHALFIVFVVLGGLLALRWRPVIWVHLPAVVWAFLLELFGWLCPLTPLEQRLREAAGSAGYSGSFLEHYLILLVYPPGLTREIQVSLAVGVVVINVCVYWIVWRQRGKRHN